MPLLDYDRERKLFVFTHVEAGFGIPQGMRIDMTKGGRGIVFEDVSPKNWYNLKVYKTRYGNDARATKSAIERIGEMKTERERDYTMEYADLLAGHPYRHQVVTIEAMQKADRLALLIEQGLGKTYCALMAMRLFKAREGSVRAIVVCPSITYQSWCAEVAKFAPDLKLVGYRGDAASRRALRNGLEDFDLLLTTYDMLRGSKSQSGKAYCGLGWELLPKDSRSIIAAELFVDGSDGRDRLSAEIGEMSDSAKKRWRTACVAEMPSPLEDAEWRRFVAAHAGARRQLGEYQNNVRQVMLEDTPDKFLNGLRPTMLVFDEASKLISYKSRQANAAERLVAKRKYLMSGTLCVGRPTDMFMPFRILDQAILGMNWFQFMHKFCEVSKYNKHIVTGYRNLDVLKQMIDPFSIEFKREDCLDLPDRTMVTCYYVPDPAIVRLYDRIVSAGDCVTLDDGTKVFCTLYVQKLQKCLQLLSGFVNPSDEFRLCANCGEERIVACAMGGVKPGSSRCVAKPVDDGPVPDARPIELVQDSGNAKLRMLENDLDNIVGTEKAIIWYWYRFDFDKITGLLDRKGIRYITANEENCALRFEADSDVRVFVGQTQQGIGITLNSATTTIYYSHGTGLEARLQSMDRNMRIGQSKPIVVRDYVCRGSIEEDIVFLLQHKEDVKTFMQQNLSCFACSEMQGCYEKGIKIYQPGCLHHTQMKKAETKHTLKLRRL